MALVNQPTLAGCANHFRLGQIFPPTGLSVLVGYVTQFLQWQVGELVSKTSLPNEAKYRSKLNVRGNR